MVAVATGMSAHDSVCYLEDLLGDSYWLCMGSRVGKMALIAKIKDLKEDQ